MKLAKALLYSYLLFIAGCNTATRTEKETHLTGFVDPFIGTGGHGHVFPGATTPFGMVQVSPNNGVSGWDWCSGYHISSNQLAGFTHMNLSGTGIGDLSDILITPTTSTVVSDTSAGGRNFTTHYFSNYSHKDEEASPGYYTVSLSNGIKAELTASPRTAFHRYTTNNKELSLIIDLGFAINWDRPTESYIKQVSDTRIVGYRKSSGWAKEQWVFFAIDTDRPFSSFSTVNKGKITGSKELYNKQAKGIIRFSNTDSKQVMIKVGLSSASIESAIKSIEKEIPHWNFEQTKAEAEAGWEKELSKIKVTTTDTTKLRIFYTALYHSFTAPYLHSDLNDEYKGLNGKVNKTDGFTRYTVFSLWDTFRANNPLFTITQPDRVNDFIRSFLAIYHEGGLLPVWELVGNETNCMIGYHAIPVITDAWKKGLITDIDGNELLVAMVKSAMQDKNGLKELRKYGYIPADKVNESVSKGLEYAYDDWCIAEMAGILDNSDIYKQFIKRAGYYKNYYDPATGFMRGKLSNGKWKSPFDPLYSSHRTDEYTEGNAWQYSWFVPHDVSGLIKLHGSAQKFETMLDSLFSIKETIKGDNVSPDISGLIGQYAHGNEPSHHIAYLYNYVGKPWKTAEKVRQILNIMYSAKPDGLSGNEDCGQMSAWYIFSSIGFYPVNPADGNYVLGSPLFDKVVFDLDNGNKFTVIAKNNSPENIYIQSATLNGKPLTRNFIEHKDIVEGGTLTLVMGNKPNKEWGSAPEDVPPSMIGVE
ncbi:MAG: glycoside hydrolase family 92 protein [Chlorobi bacterium]|nr:glycoside hydrolase family 92 protein [Chlorobiota bacterium]